MKTKKKTPREFKPTLISILTEKQAKVYHDEAETIRKIDAQSLCKGGLFELLEEGSNQMEKKDFKIATEELSNL